VAATKVGCGIFVVVDVMCCVLLLTYTHTLAACHAVNRACATNYFSEYTSHLTHAPRSSQRTLPECAPRISSLWLSALTLSLYSLSSVISSLVS